MTTADDLMARTTGVLEKQNSFRGMLYGGTGVGKSVIAAQMLDSIVPPNLGILHVDTSEGWASLRNHKEQLNLKRFRTQPFTTIEDLQVLVDAIRSRYKMFGALGGIMFDEASVMVNKDINRIHQHRVANWPPSSNREPDPTPGWPDYSAALTRWTNIMYPLFEIPDFHIILVAHERNQKAMINKEMVVTSICADFSPAIINEVKQPLHLVARITAREEKDPRNPKDMGYARFAQIKPTGLIDAKTRIPYPRIEIPVPDLAGTTSHWLQTPPEEIVQVIEAPREARREDLIVPATPEEIADASADLGADFEPIQS